MLTVNYLIYIWRWKTGLGKGERCLQELNSVDTPPCSSLGTAQFLSSYSDTNLMKKLSLPAIFIFSLPTNFGKHCRMNSTFCHYKINIKVYAKSNTSKLYKQSYTDNISGLFILKYSPMLLNIFKLCHSTISVATISIV